jgi:hypothetical protein
MSARKRMKVNDISELPLHGSEWSDSEGAGNDESDRHKDSSSRETV